ncbi:MAG: hypothetical protein ACYCX3_03155 [Thermoleophilia bacterium]
MGILDKLTEGAQKVAEQAEKALEQGKTKVEELQLERQMDGVAKKLGYLEFDAYRGRPVDAAVRRSYLDELAGLEEQVAQTKEGAVESEDVVSAEAAPPADPPAEATE